MKKRILFIAGCLLIITLGWSQNSKRVGELRRMKRATQELIEETNRMLSDTKKSTLNSLNRLNILTQEIKTRRQLINTLNDELSEIDKEQRAITREVERLEQELGGKKKKYADAVRSLYRKRSGVDEMVFVLSANSMTQSYRRMRYLQEYSAWRKEQAREISNSQQVLREKRDTLEKKKEEKRSLLSDRKEETEKLRVKEADQQEIVNDLQKKQKDLQAELKKQQQQSRELDMQIQRMIEEEARKSVKKTDTKAATKGGYAMDKKETQLSGSFEKNKGRLPFPVNGSYVIVGRFGQQQHAQLKYVTVNNNGIDIQTKPGAEARAVFDGKVTKVLVLPGYNMSVIVRHGNYLTVYSNLSDVYVKVGDTVKARQSIGRIFTDSEAGNLTKMQFQLWKEMTKLNPEPWLAK